MKKALLATTFLTLYTGTVHAQVANSCMTDPVTGNTFCDPTAFHVSSPNDMGTSSPVLLGDSNTFTIQEVGNHDITQPIRVYFIEPLGAALPTITSATGTGVIGGVTKAFTFGATTTATATAFDQTNGLFDGPDVTISSGQDFGKEMNLKGADASVSFANFKLIYAALGLTLPTTFQLEDAVFPVGFNSDSDSITINGSFGLGTIIAPLAVNVSVGSNGHLDITTYDTSWTNAGFVNKLSVPVPETSTWVMLLTGFGLMAWGAATRKRLREFY